MHVCTADLPGGLSELRRESAASAVPRTLRSDHTLGLEVGSTMMHVCMYVITAAMHEY